MNPSKQAQASGQFQSIGNQKASIQNSNFNQNTLNLMGETVFNTVYQSQPNQNVAQSTQKIINNQTIKSKYIVLIFTNIVKEVQQIKDNI